MGAPQANTFKAIRDGQDLQGDLGWSSQVAKKVVRMSPGLPDGIEDLFELSAAERVLWWLLKIPRRYIDVENAGVLPPDVARRVMRALVSAEAAVVVDNESPKPIIPIEVVRLKKKAKGVAVSKTATGRLKARVYRPDISGAQPAPAATQGAAPSGETTATSPPTGTPPPSAKSAGEARAASQGASVSTTPPSPAAVPPPVDIGSNIRPAAATRNTDAPAAVALDAAARELQKRIESRYDKLKSQNHYQVLDISPTAAAADVKKAYFALVKDFHPDVVAGTPLESDPRLVKKLNVIFRRVQDAHGLLTKEDERKQYDEMLRSDPNAGAAAAVGGKTRRPEEARMLATKAHHLMKAKEYATAERTYMQAHDFDPQNIEVRLGLAWCLYLNEARPKSERVAVAREKLEGLAKGGLAEAAWKLAYIARAEEDTEAFARHVAQTLRMNPRHVEALREKRLEEMRRQKQEESVQKPSGFLDKFKRRS